MALHFQAITLPNERARVAQRQHAIISRMLFRRADLSGRARGADGRAQARDGGGAVRGGRQPAHRHLLVDVQQFGRRGRRALLQDHQRRHHQPPQLHAGRRHGLRHAGLLGLQRCRQAAHTLHLPGRRRR